MMTTISGGKRRCGRRLSRCGRWWGAENADTDMITADTMEAMDIPFLSGTTPMLIKRGVDGQDRITYYRLKIKSASNLYRDFFVLMRVCLFFKFFLMKLCAIKLIKKLFIEYLPLKNLTF